MSAGPLAGRRIVVTRARHQASALSAELISLGAEVVELPAIEIVPPVSYAPLDNALSNLSKYQFLVVTSANTARVLVERSLVLGIDQAVFGSLVVVAIGSSTGQALENAGIPVSMVPERYVGEALAAAIKDKVKGSRVLLARASVARDVVPSELTRCGAVVDIVDAYRTVLPQESVIRLRELFAPDGKLPDAVTFTSSSTVSNFFRLLAEAGTRLGGQVKAVSIGPITSATLREHGWEPAAEASEHNVAGIIHATMELLSRS